MNEELDIDLVIYTGLVRALERILNIKQRNPNNAQ